MIRDYRKFLITNFEFMRMPTQNTPIVSINKIIFFVVFVSAALITSLFLFHLRQKPQVAALSTDIGMVFPVARDIKDFNLITANNQAFTQKNFYNHWTLLFFGFTHCASVCPTTLDTMSKAYVGLHALYPNLQVALVSLDPERDTPASLDNYTRAYQADFIGVTGKIQELRKLQSQLGVYSERDSAANTNYQIQHTSSIMLVNPQGKWQGLFKFGLKPEQLAQAVTTSIEQSQADQKS